ncbi:MAG: hypothetical protein QOC97_250, partial [Chloroflexota bacterium]|nr:hypothetical protein [Chloroflexota bacterium]
MTGLARAARPFERVARLPILSPLAVH